MLKRFGCVAALLLLTCGGASGVTKTKGAIKKNTNITIKRGVVNGDSSFNQWLNGGQHPRRFALPTRKP